MKRFLLIFAIFVLCFSIISCDELLSGIGNDSGHGEITKGTPIGTMPSETIVATLETDVDMYICVDWSDFVKIDGVVYDGMFENLTVDESMIGEKIGEILYNVGSSFYTQAELDKAESKNYSSYIRPVGCAIYAVKNDEDSIAVLDGGKYYLYTLRSNSSIPFKVFGGETYGLPGANDNNRGVTVNSFDQLCEAFGGENALPTELKERYGGDKLNDITLIIAELVSGWGGTEYGISSVSKSGDDLLVSAVQLDTDAEGDCAMHYWTFYIEIPKTDDKDVMVNVHTVKPLENDTELYEITYSAMQNYVYYEPGADYRRYEGKAVLNKYAAEEIARGLGKYDGYSSFVRFCPTNNYWLVSLSLSNGSSTHIIDVVIRAADGRIISQIEAIGCS